MDGATWIRKVPEHHPQATYRLDPFHLKRAMRRGLRRDLEAHQQLAAALKAGEPWPEVATIRKAARRRTQCDDRDRIQALCRFVALPAPPHPLVLPFHQGQDHTAFHGLAGRLPTGLLPSGRWEVEKVDGELGTLLTKLVLGLVGGGLTLIGLAGLIQGSLSSLRVPNRVVATVVFIVGLALVTIFGEPDLVTKILAAMAE
ncbi:UPF0236 family transposase-like protein [Thermaerobacter composti]|uniref:UPF0236 family protein n=1 Tax=Thermaerobacter composti TaxID=554949 RepID=A0ABZ0QRG7_9FIRM|nr:UPF0236 family protein [Thermaerobacter composti]WPD19162.1 UPF0236 family protein [Thermaerobacter composti]